jgi:hypothetical protein
MVNIKQFQEAGYAFITTLITSIKYIPINRKIKFQTL